MKSVFHTLALAGMSCSLIQAQEISDTTKNNSLKEVIVSATRSEKDPAEVGRSTTVISKEEIKNSGANSLAELLSEQEGIYVVGGQQAPGSLSNIFMRGANSNAVVIMIDGVRITDPTSTDNSIDLSEISLSNIERIEIVRGSHSVMYGSSAIGGVVNLITKKNFERSGLHIDAEVKAGVFNPNGSLQTENLFLNYSDKSGFYASAEVFNTSCAGFDAVVDTFKNPKSYQFGSNPFTKTDLFGKLGYKKNKLDIFVSYKSVEQKTSIDDGAYRYDPAYSQNFNRNLFIYGAAYRFNDKLSISWYGGYSTMERKLVQDSSLANPSIYNTEDYKGSVFSNDLQMNYHTKGIDLVAGVSSYIEKMTATTLTYSSSASPYGFYESNSDLDSLKIKEVTQSGFLHADLNGVLISQRLAVLTLSLGGRLVNNSEFGNAFVYEINPTLKLSNNTLLYASYTTGFNTPSLYELYSPQSTSPTGFDQIALGDSKLVPEESNSFELGIKQKVNERVWFSIAYFNTVVKNDIEYAYLWNRSKPVDSLTYADYRGDTYVNAGEQYAHGFEFSIGSKISDKLLLSANLSLIQGEIKYQASGIDTSHTKGNLVQLFSNGAYLTQSTTSVGLVRRPSTANIFLTYKPLHKLILKADVRFAGARSDIYYDSSLGPNGALNSSMVQDYTLLDCSASYEFAKGLFGSVRVENILNTQYSEIIGYATRGRGFYGGLRYVF